MNKHRLFFITDWIRDLDFWRTFYEQNAVSWLHVGGEESTDTGRLHMHVSLYFTHQHTISSVIKKTIGRHVVVARGTVSECSDYATKHAGTTLELGNFPSPGTRNDLTCIRDHILGGGSVRDIVHTMDSYQQLRFAEGLQRYSRIRRSEPPIVTWLWGPTGSGKSRRAFEEAGPDAWFSNRDLTWWEGYDGQTHIILDDFRGSFCPLSELLRILDRYPYRVMYKGGSCELRATHIWITSCSHPVDCYASTQEKIDQLLRRITSIHHLTKNGSEVDG